MFQLTYNDLTVRLPQRNQTTVQKGGVGYPG